MKTMEENSANENFRNHYKTYSPGIAIFVLTATLTYVIHLTWKRLRFVSKVKKLPSHKWKFYHILGDATHSLRIRWMKTHLPHHVYDLLIFNAYSVLYQKESFFNLWAAFWPIIMVHKADAVELIGERKRMFLNSKTSIVKESEDNPSSKRKAFLDLLLDEHINNNSISEEEIKEEVNTFTFAGHDTSSTAASFSMYLIGLHPGIQEKVRQELDSIFGDDDREVTLDDLREMKYLECVLKECLRLYPPVSLFGREITHAIQFKGHIIPEGCTVAVFSHILHRDPEVFPNPEKFDPDRFSLVNSIGRNTFAYIPFSAGPRNCIGQRFALMELKIVISSILRNFQVRSLDPRDRIHLVTEAVMRPVEKLRLEIRPRDYKPEKPPAYFYSA